MAFPSPNATSSDPLLGELVAGAYRLDALIARGSMGKVYRATQLRLQRPVALKLLDPSALQMAGAGEFEARFLREGSMLGRLTHPNTVRVYDFGLGEHGSYLAMEYIQGTTLRELTQRGPLQPRDAIHIARQIAESVGEAHNLGLVHRDLKPGNVLITTVLGDDKFVKVVDFGLVKEIDGSGVEVTGVGMMLGTPLYMSPEQIRGANIDQRADIYAIGMLLYRMFTGAAPWPTTHTSAVLMAHLSEKPAPFAAVAPNLVLPAACEWVVRRCLAKDANDRFNDSWELVRALAFAQLALDSAQHRALVPSLVDGVVVLPPGAEAFAPPARPAGGTPRPARTRPAAPPRSVSGPPAPPANTVPEWLAPMAAGASGVVITTVAVIGLIVAIAALAQ